jgi:hypothetical protein
MRKGILSFLIFILLLFIIVFILSLTSIRHELGGTHLLLLIDLKSSSIYTEKTEDFKTS